MFFDEKEIEAVINKVIDIYLIPKFHQHDMNATGEWINSLEVEVLEDKAKIKGRHYTEYLAKGRPPSNNLPPISALKKWVSAKFGINGKEAEQRAWAIAKKIQKHGTTHYRKGGTDLLEVLESPEVVNFIREKIKGIVRISIVKRLQRNALDYLR